MEIPGAWRLNGDGMATNGSSYLVMSCDHMEELGNHFEPYPPDFE